MGIPMFVEPTVIETRCKTDPTAPARSSIRRTRTIRAHDSANRSPRAGNYTHSRPRSQRSILDLVRHSGDHDSIQSRPTTRTDQAAEADTTRRAVADRRRRESGRPLLRDALSYERPGRMAWLRHGTSALSTTAGPPGTVPDASFSTSIHAWTNTPSLGDGRLDGLRGLNGHRRGQTHGPVSIDYRSGGVPYSHRFAPAHRFDDIDHEHFTDHSITSEEAREMRSEDESSNFIPDFYDRYGNAALRSDENELPPLRRMGRRSILDVRAEQSATARDHDDLRRNNGNAPVAATRTTVDGLGDRERSISIEDSWGPLLATITPDAHLPSADSSFTSAHASASASGPGTASASSNPATSASTSITTPDAEYEGLAAICPHDGMTSDEDDDQDMSDGSDRGEDDEDPSMHNYSRRRLYHEGFGDMRYALMQDRVSGTGNSPRNEPSDQTRAHMQRQLGNQSDGALDGPGEDNTYAFIDDVVQEAERQVAASQRRQSAQATRPQDSYTAILLERQRLLTERQRQYAEEMRESQHEQSRNHIDELNRMWGRQRAEESRARRRSRSPTTGAPRSAASLERTFGPAHASAWRFALLPEDEAGNPDLLRMEEQLAAVNAEDEDENEQDEEVDPERAELDRIDEEQHLHGMRELLERLGSREDIPDEWWTAAGLRRELAGRVERLERQGP